MILRGLLGRLGLQKKREEKEEGEEGYGIVLEEISPIEYLNGLKKKKDKISDIMKFTDIHDLLSESKMDDREEELSRLG